MTAVGLANPGLVAAVETILAADPDAVRVKRLRRAVTALGSYLLRWQRLATPFGMFAGITAARIGPATTATIGTRHRVAAQPDGDWLAAIGDHLEHHPGLLDRPIVVADNSAVVRDGQLILYPRAEPGATTPGTFRETSIRLAAPVRTVLEAASAPTPLADLVDQLRQRFPTVATESCGRCSTGSSPPTCLLSILRPPMTATDPLGVRYSVVDVSLPTAGSTATPDTGPPPGLRLVPSFGLPGRAVRQPQGSLSASTSTGSTDGGFANNSSDR